MSKTKEQRYEEVVNAVAGGELQMVKLIWGLLEEVDSIVQKTPQAIIDKRVAEVDAILEKLRKNPPQNGVSPSKQEIIELIRPLIPPAVPGKNGKTPTTERLLALIEPLIPDIPVAIPGIQGKPGPRGVAGRVPKHEWSGTFLRFELPGGEWGPWTNLQGVPSEGGGMPFQGAPEAVIKAGTDISVRRDASGAYVITYTGTGGGGGGTTYEVPIGDVDAINASFVVSAEPKSVISDGLKYFDGAGYTYSAPNIVMDIPPSSFIRAEVSI